MKKFLKIVFVSLFGLIFAADALSHIWDIGSHFTGLAPNDYSYLLWFIDTPVFLIVSYYVLFYKKSPLSGKYDFASDDKVRILYKKLTCLFAYVVFIGLMIYLTSQ